MSSPAPHPGYAHDDPFDEGFLSVSDIHALYYHQYGNPDGKPVLFLHGGPGGSTSKPNTAYFNPSTYRVVLLDQRGSGRSTPTAELRDNTTWHHLSDLEVLRTHLSIPKWHLVFGGSWGSTLALLYAQHRPQLVGALVVHGVFTVRESELDWRTRQPGPAVRLYPDLFERFLAHLPEGDRDDDDVYGGYYRLLTSGDRATAVAAARAWNAWDVSIGTMRVDEGKLRRIDEDEGWSLSHARLECHYFLNRGFMEDGHILRPESLGKIRGIPMSVVQGRYDLVCPPQTAYELRQGLPESRLFWVPDAGHSATEPGIRQKLIEVCDEYAQLPYER
ncbi:Proline iminopeptidase [Coniochaeta hoffmannii]|uniref:Proline iminopeptidase n=1 Tax=Coniochaeta hoffmannii TaxID=91930 RepID=A0AA38RUL1_9PEZI|nr:Proline iminopeptidase [Coniochaeta hoffmannii]